MGSVQFVLKIGNVAENQIATVKNAIDDQIAAWMLAYPTLTFERGNIGWNEG